jgi:hypothetical protein
MLFAILEDRDGSNCTLIWEIYYHIFLSTPAIGLLRELVERLPYKLAYKPPLCYKPPWLISPLLAKGRCKICMAHRPSTIVNKSLCYKPPPRERSFVSHGPHRGGLYASLYGTPLDRIYWSVGLYPTKDRKGKKAAGGGILAQIPKL